MNEEKVIKMLSKHEKDIGYIKENMATKKDLRQIDTQIDLLAKKFLEHDERLDRIETNMATKKDLNKISNTLDKLVALTEKKDQELTITTHDMRHIEDRVEVLEKDMRQVKPALNLA